jgi:hypothetical protein
MKANCGESSAKGAGNTKIGFHKTSFYNEIKK